MNAIRYALDQVKRRIPKGILEEVFRPKDYIYQQSLYNVDHLMETQVIRPRVMTDCDIVGGTEVIISLDGLNVTRLDPITTVFRVPKDVTNGRTITSALSIGYGNASMLALPGLTGSFKPCSVTPLLQAGQAMLDQHMPIPVSGTARLQLIAENTIMVRDPTTALGAISFLRCILANDENLSHIQTKSYLHFAKLCELAVKSYIYNEYALVLDRAFITGGYEIGKFKEMVDSYADSEEMYQTYLTETWQAVAFMNDSETYQRYMTRLAGGFI